MKKLKICLLMVFIICLFSFTKVLAADATAELTLDKTTAKPGDTITATLSVNCQDGISYVGTKIEYNTSILTLQRKEVAEHFRDYESASSSKISLMVDFDPETEQAQIIQNANVCTFVFKVNDNATAGIARISTTQIEITDINNGEYTKLGLEKPLTITKDEEPPIDPPTEKSLTKIEVTTTPKKTTYEEGDKFDKTGMVVTAYYSDGTSKTVTDYSYSPTGELKTTDKTITIIYKEGNTTKTAIVSIKVTEKSGGTPGGEEKPSGTDPEKKPSSEQDDKAKSDLPNTGINSIIIGAIAIIITTMIISYARYKKYNKI